MIDRDYYIWKHEEDIWYIGSGVALALMSEQEQAGVFFYIDRNPRM